MGSDNRSDFFLPTQKGKYSKLKAVVGAKEHR